MTKDSTWLTLCDDIDDGHYDDALDEIARAVVSRRDVVIRRNARRLVRNLIPNETKVRLTNGIKPRFYEGMVGIIREVLGDAAIVELTGTPSKSGRGRPPAEGFQSRLRVAIVNLEVLDPNIMVTSPGKADIGDDEDYEDIEEEDDDDDAEDDDDDDDDDDDEPPVKPAKAGASKKKK